MQTNPLSLEQALKGKISGVQVMNNDGAPGGGITIKIRGSVVLLRQVVHLWYVIRWFSSPYFGRSSGKSFGYYLS